VAPLHHQPQVVICSWPAKADGPQPVPVSSISTVSLGLVVDSPIQIGALLRVEFEHESEGTGLARGVHAREDEGGWLPRCSLGGLIAEAELQTLQLRPSSE
jgi:hypothetical protein